MKSIPAFTVFILSIIVGVTNAFTIDSAMVPMSDSIDLATHIYLPEFSSGPWPVLLQRTPYNRRESDLPIVLCDIMNYAFVSQNVRGTRESEGEPMVFLTDGWGEHIDGYDCIDWIVSQSWCNGRVGMVGASAPGMTQYMAVGALHPNLTMICPIFAGPSMYHYVTFQGGVFRKKLVETWLTGLGTPWLIDTIANHPIYDELWSHVDLTTRYDSVSVPGFHVSGWFDMYTDGQLDAFGQLQLLHGNNKLLIAPCGHGDAVGTLEQGDLVYPPNALMTEADFIEIARRWYDYWLKDSPTGIMDEPPVQFYLSGDCDTSDTTLFNRWMTAETWPLPESEYREYYLTASGILDTIFPTDSTSLSYVYDPEDPSPTVGGREFIGMDDIGYGPKDQSILVEPRSDILIFTTPMLTEPMAVIGKIKMILFASSDRLDTDFAVRVTDVYPDGRSILMTDGILKARHRHGLDVEDMLSPGIPDTFEIDVWSIANVFNTGHRIRAIVSSANYPRFEANPNTGGPFVRNDPVTLVATNTVFMSEEMPSHLLLPIYPLDTTGIREYSSLPERIAIRTYPNPFNSAVRIAIDAPVGEGLVPSRVEIFDIAGRLVAEISVEEGFTPSRLSQTTKTGGSETTPLRNEYIWQPDPSFGSGIYLVRARVGEDEVTKRVVFMK